MKLSIVTSAVKEPVTVEECKLHLRLESTDDDIYIESLIPVARKQAEHIMKRTLMPTVYKLILPDFQNGTAEIELPMPPLSTVSSNVTITIVEDTTVYQTTVVPATVYVVDADSEPGRIYPAYGTNVWPSSVSSERKDGVTIQYTAGYVGRKNVPEPIKVWIKMRVASLYENREPIVETGGRFSASLQSLPHSFYDGLLDPYIVI